MLISSVQVGGAGEGGVPTESWSLHYAKIEMTYTQIGTDGKPAGKGASVGWDLKENKSLSVLTTPGTMADDFTQANRRLRIETPLGPDALLITALSGTEGISTLFHFQAELLGRDERADFDAIVGAERHHLHRGRRRRPAT